MEQNQHWQTTSHPRENDQQCCHKEAQNAVHNLAGQTHFVFLCKEVERQKASLFPFSFCSLSFPTDNLLSDQLLAQARPHCLSQRGWPTTLFSSCLTSVQPTCPRSIAHSVRLMLISCSLTTCWPTGIFPAMTPLSVLTMLCYVGKGTDGIANLAKSCTCFLGFHDNDLHNKLEASVGNDHVAMPIVFDNAALATHMFTEILLTKSKLAMQVMARPQCSLPLFGHQTMHVLTPLSSFESPESWFFLQFA